MYAFRWLIGARAAELLDLTPSAVSHQLAKLEVMIGRQLFFRTARGVTLTPVGEQLPIGVWSVMPGTYNGDQITGS